MQPMAGRWFWGDSISLYALSHVWNRHLLLWNSFIIVELIRFECSFCHNE
jgi:hypothetical protein